MEQINLIQSKGGQGTSVVACAVALQAATDGWWVRLDGHDRGELAAILGVNGDGPVIPRLFLGNSDEASPELVVFDGPAAHGRDLLVMRPCYLALRQALTLGLCERAVGAVLVTEAGRALSGEDIASITGLPIVATIPQRADIARAVDAGVLADRLPDALAVAARQILHHAISATGKEVA